MFTYKVSPSYAIVTTVIGSDNIDLTQRFLKKRFRSRLISSLSNYEVIFNFNKYKNLSSRNFGDSDKNSSGERSCIYCLKKEGDVSFSNESHAIPEFLGNRYLINYNECDICNSFFCQTIEDALDKYTRIYRTLNLIKNKNRKIIKAMSIDGKSSTRYNSDKDIYEIIGRLDKDFFVDYENKTIKTINEVHKHRPINVYKAFFKITYGLLPKNERENFKKSRSWLMSKDINEFLVSRFPVRKTIISKIDKNKLDVYILKTKALSLQQVLDKNIMNEDFDYIALIGFGNVVFEFPLFSDIALEKINTVDGFAFNLKVIPKDYDVVICEQKDLSCVDYTIEHEVIEFVFDSITN